MPHQSFWDTLVQLMFLGGGALCLLVCLVMLDDMLSSIKGWNDRRKEVRKDKLIDLHLVP